MLLQVDNKYEYKDYKKKLLLSLSKMIGDNYNTAINITNENYIGFFQWVSSIDQTLTHSQKCLISVEYFKLFFHSYFNSFIIATSIIGNSQIMNKKQKEYLLAIKGYILPLDFNLVFSEKYKQEDFIDQAYSEITSSFRFFSKFTQDDLIDLSFVCMSSDILRSGDGYLFFIIPSLNIIIYPHDDIGFGCFFIEKNKSYKEGSNFIKNIVEFNDNFSIFLKSIN